MTSEEMKRVIEHVEQGHKVMYHSHYVDGFLSIYEEGDEWFYTSYVWAKTPLKELEVCMLSFYIPVDF